MSEDMRLAVKRGAHWLDENYPGWALKINLNNFSMLSCERCVVGQAIGDYSLTIYNAASGSELWDIDSWHWAVNNGFDAPGLEESQYMELEILWTEQVKERL